MSHWRRLVCVHLPPGDRCNRRLYHGRAGRGRRQPLLVRVDHGGDGRVGLVLLACLLLLLPGEFFRCDLSRVSDLKSTVSDPIYSIRSDPIQSNPSDPIRSVIADRYFQSALCLIRSVLSYPIYRIRWIRSGPSRSHAIYRIRFDLLIRVAYPNQLTHSIRSDVSNVLSIRSDRRLLMVVGIHI